MKIIKNFINITIKFLILFRILGKNRSQYILKQINYLLFVAIREEIIKSLLVIGENNMRNKIFRKVMTLVTMVAAAGTVMMAAACSTSNTIDAEGTTVSSYEHAIDILNAVWDKSTHDFPAYGGNFEKNVDNAPGEIPLADKDTMTSTLLIPEDVQAHVSEVATIFHMMNTNTLTGASLKLDGNISSDEVSGKIKDSFKNNQFMCGIPEEIVIYTVGDNELVYFYGAVEIIDGLQTGADGLDGAKLAVKENY